MTVIPAYHTLIRSIVVTHDRRIDALRHKHGQGLQCGNGYVVRPASYYDELWHICIDYLAQMLELHELTLLVLNSRWLDLRKALGRMESAETRISDKNVQHAHPQTVQSVLERREEELMRRVSMDGRGELLLQGPQRWPSSEGHFDGSQSAWFDQPVEGHPDRPDAPTYHQMVLFDQLIDYTPAQHEQHGKSEDEEMVLLTERTLRMAVDAANHAASDPQHSSRHHQLPMPSPGQPSQTAQTKRAPASEQARSTSTKNKRSRGREPDCDMQEG